MSASRTTTSVFKMEMPKMPRFSGDVRDYVIFQAGFKHAVNSRFSKRDAISLLRASLSGKPLELIKGIGSDYDVAWEHLDAMYGDPRFIADTVSQKEATLENLIAWMTTEMKTRMRAIAPLRSMQSRHPVGSFNANVPGSNFKCWVCKSSNHFVDPCRKFSSMNATERLQAVKDNHACYSCLKRAGRDHKSSNCSRRCQCPQ